MNAKSLIRTLPVALVVVASAVGIAIAASATPAPATAVVAAASTSASAAPTLDGAKVYAANCGSCHSERWPNERTDGEWKLIVMHMRVRANLTGAEADAVLLYLQASNKDK